jgi:hypothetical protein
MIRQKEMGKIRKNNIKFDSLFGILTTITTNNDYFFVFGK